MPQKEGEKRLLIIDGHGSHATDDFMFECFYNGIYVLWLPPHFPHVTQPLDMGVFGPVKNAYRRALSQLDSDDDSSLQSKISFLSVTTMQGRLESHEKISLPGSKHLDSGQ